MRIPISKKHGVNPSLTVCFFCGKHTGIALMGRLKGDAKAPYEVMCDYEPCDECKKKFEQGSLLLEVDTRPLVNGQLAIQKKDNHELYPTGRFKLIKREACERIFGQAHDKALLEVDLYKQLFDEIDKQILNGTYPNEEAQDDNSKQSEEIGRAHV